ncbi:hypothetical protein ACFQY0_13220 [Haloferula chungangensis]|uniref:Uncharacterized protein n=1 Tax=Haloferula chungangensis TaxID=1048331 RepID=A0ABW2L6W7_9BACT
MKRNQRLVIQVIVLLLLVWGAVSGVRMLAGTQRVTAEKVAREIDAANFDDWSELDDLPKNAEAKGRAKMITEIAGMVNVLDFAEREKAREERIGENFFRRLAPPEKEKFINLTIEKSMETFMKALDALNPEERRKFVEDGLREIEDGRTEEEMKRTREMSEDLLKRIADEGMKSYFENASADTKIDLAPLMEAMDDVMKGMRGREFGPPQ